MTTLRELIADGRTHLFDGAMGTVLYGRGVFLNVCYDELSLRQLPALRASRMAPSLQLKTL